MNGKTCKLRMHAHMFVGVCVHVCVCVCVCTCMHAHIKSIKCFLTLKCIHYFFQKRQDLSKQNKMSNITTEMKTLELSTKY